VTRAWRIGFRGGLTLEDLPFGSTLADGRWHLASQRRPVVYAAGSRALAQLEKRVHCNGSTPKDQALIRLELPRGAALLDARDLGLAEDWRSSSASTQAIGLEWLASRRSLGLWVPSYVVPQESNLLLNPAHARYAEVRVVVEQDPFEFDPRIF
jgi:RES domain-containing protein